MGNHEDLGEFEGMDQRLSQSISKTAALVRFSSSAVASIYQKRPKEGTVVNQ